MTIEEIVQRFITELESQGLKYEAYFKMSLATSMRGARHAACSGQIAGAAYPAQCGKTERPTDPGERTEEPRRREHGVVQRGLEEDDYLFRQAGEIRWCLGHSHSGSKGFCGRENCRTI